LAFERGMLLFIFNFSPDKSYTDYGILAHPGKYTVTLSSDSKKFGGFGNIDESVLYISERIGGVSGKDWLKVYMPPRTALVLKRKPTLSVYDIN
jgi:1,4-alpha-glucan branching enzyme